MIWLEGSSPGLPSNFGMSEGSLFGIIQLGSWKMGSLINLFKLGRFKPAMKGIEGWLALALGLAPTMVELGLDEDEGPKEVEVGP
jgi:hypothetical protein